MEIFQSFKWWMHWNFFKLIPDLSRGNLTELGFGWLLVATLSSGLLWCMYVCMYVYLNVYMFLDSNWFGTLYMHMFEFRDANTLTSYRSYLWLFFLQLNVIACNFAKKKINSMQWVQWQNLDGWSLLFLVVHP